MGSVERKDDAHRLSFADLDDWRGRTALPMSARPIACGSHEKRKDIRILLSDPSWAALAGGASNFKPARSGPGCDALAVNAAHATLFTFIL